MMFWAAVYQGEGVSVRNLDDLGGVAFDTKDGVGMNGEPFMNVGIHGPFIIRPRKERRAGASETEPEVYDDGADFLE